MSNPYAPGGQDPWNQGNGQGGFPGSQQSYGQADPNAYAQGGYVDQTQQMSNGYMDQYPAQYGAGMTPGEPKSKLPLIIGGIAGVLVLILIGAAHTSSSAARRRGSGFGLHLHQCDGRPDD